jgi:APA family basic amino acid/polyamine antiporter
MSITPKISMLASVFLVIASMLGSGILTTSGSILSCVKSTEAAMLVWLIAGIHALAGAYCYGIIMRKISVNGGEASILRAFFSIALGQIAGWVSFIVGFAASNAATAIGFAAYLGKATPNLAFGQKTAAVCAIVVVSLLHSFAGKFGMRAQTALAALKFAMLVGLTICGLLIMPTGIEPAAAQAMQPLAPQQASWGTAIMLSMFAYLGWNAAIYSAAETKNAKHNVPRAMMIGAVFVMIIYIGVNLSLFRHVPFEVISSEKAVMEVLVRRLFGEHASRPFAGAVAFALLSSLGAAAFLGPRVLQAMLLWRHSESRAAKTNSLNLLVWIQGGISILLVATATFEQILTTTGFMLGIFPLLSVLGLYTKSANEQEKVSFFARWFAAPIFVIGSLFILLLGSYENPIEMGIAMMILFFIFAFLHGTKIGKRRQS